ncbi:restriction endonuclease subunit S [Citrobacter freundii]
MVPKLRFSKFSKEWTKIRLGDYLQNYQKKVSSDTDIPVYSSSRQGLKPQAEYFADRELQNDGEYGVVPFGYITYRHMSDDNTFHFNLNNKLPEIAVSKEYPVFTGKGLNNYFLLSKLNHTDEFKLFAIQQKAGGTRTRLYFKNLCEWRATFPELEEQIQISDFLSSVDERIKLLSKQYDLLCRYKKGMMQKIFSQEVRFKDNQGRTFPKWTMRKFSDFFTIGSSKRVLQDDWVNEGVPFYRTRELVSLSKKEKFKSEIFITEDNYTYLKDKYGVPAVGDFLVSGVGTLGIIHQVRNDNPFYFKDGNVLWFKKNNEINSDFFYHVFNSPKVLTQIVNHAAITTVGTYTIENAKKTKFMYPSLEEQTKIANFLSSLDDKIAVKKAELDKLKTWKQGLLQQMFV